jgi:hypothetical protein
VAGYFIDLLGFVRTNGEAGVSPFGDEVPPSLQDHLAFGRKVNADVRAVDFFLDDQRVIGDESVGLGIAQVVVVIGPLGAKEMGCPWVLDEIAM